jgi:flavin-binding protein dodecin
LLAAGVGACAELRDTINAVSAARTWIVARSETTITPANKQAITRSLKSIRCLIMLASDNEKRCVTNSRFVEYMSQVEIRST